MLSLLPSSFYNQSSSEPGALEQRETNDLESNMHFDPQIALQVGLQACQHRVGSLLGTFQTDTCECHELTHCARDVDLQGIAKSIDQDIRLCEVR